MLTPAEHAELERLVTTNEEHTEVQCGRYLHHAVKFLVPQASEVVSHELEDRNHYGSTDFVISTKIKNDQNDDEVVVYIWELKAPQCFLLELDNNKNRCRPTADFIKAENQLIHYFHQAKGDDDFRTRFNIMKSDNIKMGGIIIGRSNDRLIRGDNTTSSRAKAHHSLDIRKSIFYANYQIRVVLWDRILDFVRP